MSCFTLLRFLDVCTWILVSILFLAMDVLCQRLRSCTPNICSQRGQAYCFYCVHFLRCLFGFVLLYFLSLFSCSLFVHFLVVVWVPTFFCFYKYFFATIHLYHVHFSHCWVCIVLLFICCLLVIHLFISLVVV